MGIRFHLGAAGDTELQRKLGDELARHLAAVDLLGRLQIMRHAHLKTGKIIPISPGPTHVRFADDPHGQATAAIDFNLPNDQAARVLQALTPVTRQIFDGLTAQYRRDAFTMAGVSDVRLIVKIRDRLADVARNGQTIDDWRRAVRHLTTEAGVEDLNAFTLDTAFQTAMQKAYSAGRLEQMREPHMIEALPFWQYWTAGDFRVRPEHAVLDGFMARAIDPVWHKIYPPSGFNCRCSVVPIPEDEALQIDPKSAEGGYERLPMLARLLVPQRGFSMIQHAA